MSRIGGAGGARTTLALAVASAFSAVALANPTGPTVVNGAASFRSVGGQLTVTNAPNSIINWQSFSIGAGEITRFVQQSAASAVLNRVVSQNPSSILGALQSNGRVFLINPNGIVFGRGAQVDVAGLVASSLNLSNADFLAGRLNFTATPGAGDVVNQGVINTATGGSVYLVGPAVTNQGLIASPRGEVVLAAGNSVELVDPGTPNLRVQIAAPDNQALNLGQITAEAGRVGIYAGLVSTSGSIRADSAVAEGGKILLKATKQAAVSGELRADGVSGGAIEVSSGGDALIGGSLSAAGSAGDGGSLRISAHDVFQTSASRVDASSVGGTGGTIALTAAADGGVLFSSGSLAATGVRGGDIRLLGDRVTLWGTRADASGDTRGGSILAGGDFQGANAAVPNSNSTFVAPSTVLKADARDAGDGGKIVVWADGRTEFLGTASARGGARSGDGGFIEISGKASLYYGGTGNAGADHGRAGTLLLDPHNITIGATSSGITANATLYGLGLDDGDGLGSSVVVIKGDTHIVLAPQRDQGIDADVGAFFVLDSAAGLMTVVQGNAAGGRVGSGGVTVLANGNALVSSPQWRDFGGGSAEMGAVTWVSGSTGLLADGGNGTSINTGNSLIGNLAFDRIGSGGVQQLSGGNALVISPEWNAARGAVTWINGATGQLVDGGTGGQVAAANSLVGSTAGDQVGVGGTAVLSNGNLVVMSPQWNGARGAATWIKGDTGALSNGAVAGAVSAANSLVGATAGDQVSSSGVAALANGNALVASPYWDNGSVANAGAATWMNGSNGALYGGALAGAVSTANSVHGTTAGDQVGSGGMVALPNGNALILSPAWNDLGNVNAGAFTWIEGATGRMSDIAGVRSAPGAVSQLNSHFGAASGDRVGTDATILANGHVLVRSEHYQDFGADTGAVTWVNSADGRSAEFFDQFGNGYFDFRVTSQNSLVGRYAGDRIGSGGIVALPSGNAIILSPEWNSGRGAATWVSGTTGRHANELNSGSNVVDSNSSVAGFSPGERVGSGGVTVLPGNGNAIIRSPEVSDGTGVVGMVTWVRGADGQMADGQPMGYGFNISGQSFFGSVAGDRIGSGGVVALATGHALVVSPFMADGGTAEVGAIHFIDGTTGRLGGPNGGATGGNLDTNTAMLRGVQSYSRVGSGGAFALSTGNALVLSPEWGDSGLANLGAATILSGITGEPAASTINQIGFGNSLVGTQAGDRIGSGGALLLANGNVVVLSPAFRGSTGFPTPVAVPDVGAATWLNGTTGFDNSGSGVGRVESSNSIVGAAAGDRVGSGGAVALANNNVAVRSPDWDNDFPVLVDAGAVTWIDGATGRLANGQRGSGVSTDNSVLGTTAGERLGSGDVRGLPDGRFVVASPLYDNGLSDLNVGEAYLVTVNAGFAPGGMSYGHRPGDNYTLSPESIASTLSSGTSLVLQANNDITLAGDILVSNPLGNGGHLTLQAGRSVLFNSNTGIVTGNGNLTLIANDLAANGVREANRDTGAALVRMDSGSYIDAGTGTVTVSLRDGADRMFSDTTSGAVTLRQITAGRLDVTNAGASAATATVALNGTVSVTGNVDVQAAGSIDASGRMTVGGTMRAVSTGMNTEGQVHLDHNSNEFGGLVTLQGTGVRIRAGNGDLALAPITAEKIEANLGGFGELKLSGNYETVPGGGNYDAGIDFSANTLRLNGNTTLTASSFLNLSGAVRGAHELTLVNTGAGAGGISFNGALGDTSMDPADKLAALRVNTDYASMQYLPAINAAGTVTLKGTGLGFLGNVSALSVAAEATAGDINIGNGVQLSASGTGNSLVLAASGNFINDFDATALSAPNGRWLVYSTSPAGSTENGLVGAAGSALPRLYNRTYAANGPATIAETGNHLVYSAQPTLNVNANAASRAYGNANPAFTYSSSGFVNDDGVTDTLALAGMNGALTSAAVANSSVAGGPYAITAGTLASGAGYALNYTGANLSVTARGITVSADNLNKVYGNADPALTFAVGGGGLAGGDTAAGVFTGALTRAAGETVAGGPYAIGQGTLAANSNYNVTTFTGGQFSVTQRPVTVTANAGQTKVYGNADPGSYTYTNTGLGTGVALAGTLDRAAGENVGGYAIGQGTLTNGANPNYLLTYVSDNFGITQRPVTVTADAAQTKVYGNADPGAYAYTNTGLGTGVALVGALDRAAGENVGGYAIGQGTLTNASNSNYQLTFVSDTFSITQRSVTVTADAGQGKVYGNANPGAYTYTNTSLGTGAALVGALDRAAGENVGGYALGQGTLTNANNGNYLLTYVGDNFSIAQRPLSVVAQNASRNAAVPNPAFTTAISGFAPGEGLANLTGSVVLTTPARVESPTGRYVIRASGLSSSNYVITFVDGTLDVREPVAPQGNSDMLVAMDRALRFSGRTGLPVSPAPQCREVAPRVLDCR